MPNRLPRCAGRSRLLPPLLRESRKLRGMAHKSLWLRKPSPVQLFRVGRGSHRRAFQPFDLLISLGCLSEPFPTVSVPIGRNLHRSIGVVSTSRSLRPSLPLRPLSLGFGLTALQLELYTPRRHYATPNRGFLWDRVQKVPLTWGNVPKEICWRAVYRASLDRIEAGPAPLAGGVKPDAHERPLLCALLRPSGRDGQPRHDATAALSGALRRAGEDRPHRKADLLDW